MIHDPNADLIGFTFECEDGSFATVKRTAIWSSRYVFVDLSYPTHTVRDVLKPADAARRRKELDDLR